MNFISSWYGNPLPNVTHRSLFSLWRNVSTLFSDDMASPYRVCWINHPQKLIWTISTTRSCPTYEKRTLFVVSYRPAPCIMLHHLATSEELKNAWKYEIENLTFKRPPTKIGACPLSCLHVTAVLETQEGWRHLLFWSSWTAVDILRLKGRRRTLERTARERGKGRGGCLIENRRVVLNIARNRIVPRR